MSRHFKLITPRFEQGRRDYESGHGLDHVVNTANAMDLMHDAEGVTMEQHDEIAQSIPSYFAGYTNALIDDIRLLAANTRRGLRA